MESASRSREHPFLGGVACTLAIVGCFVAFGATWSWAEAWLRGSPGAYPAPGLEVPLVGDRTWLVDGYNVLHAGVLEGRERGGWWKAPARERLLRLLAAFDGSDDPLWVVFDGSEPDAGPESPDGPRVVFAPSADEWLVRRVKQSPDPSHLVVVTGDRRLGDRIRHHGATVVSPGEFLARCRQDPDLIRS